MALHIEQALRMLGLSGALLVASCVDTREAVQERSDAEKNIAAIRELLKPVDGRASTQSGHPPGDTSGTRGEMYNLNEVSSSPDVRSANSKYVSPSSEFMGRSKGSIHSGRTQVYIPWQPSASNSLEPVEPFRPVPPYFTTMPTVPGSPTSIRCSPDYFGGQRCH
jgi:hypothetical protein